MLENLNLYAELKNSPKNFCWDLFSDGIILNIYDNSKKDFKIPLEDKNGKIEYMGKKYKNKGVNIECL